MRQTKNPLGAITDSQGATDKFKHALDKVTSALSSELDAANKSAQGSMDNLSTKIVHRAAGVLDMPAMDPRNVIKAATDIMRKTTDSVTDMVERAATVTEAAVKASEPTLAADTLANKAEAAVSAVKAEAAKK